MLAEPVKQTSYVLQPRGKPLYEGNEDSFGMRMLTKMGWNKDKGLGAKEDGSKDFIRVKYKNTSTGMGFQDKDTQWTAHEDEFSKLLDNLKSEDAGEDARNCESLEEKSKKSRARVHYKKFTKGKDLSQYSEKDLANIFGRKTLKVEESKEEVAEEELPSSSNYGVTTTTSKMSSVEYFKKKMNAAGSSGQEISETFEQTASVDGDECEKSKKSSKKKKKRTREAEEYQETPVEEEKPKKKRKKDIQETIESVEVIQEEKPKKKRKKDRQECESAQETPQKESKKKKKAKQEEPNAAPELQAGLERYSSSGQVTFKLHKNKCDVLLNFDSRAFKGSNVHSIIGYRLNEKIDLEIFESYEGEKTGAPEEAEDGQ
ncbi:PIN2/TERF1-interacting telomerase inhibitor 1 [Phlebotomus argentipes]|uniref:PIN2/TERF1-interacting telomerase inhibitor 1 n=1 Tax=Phlebotomus argentipes TaxID=94469 RepID=UPI0028932004|nr:PIN2/TERF1-interacting telomerase inhibitor 1 [Phlebotomus argentipes]